MDASRFAALELALQNTLLGLAIAIILALVAALVGPLLIDWRGQRSLFEAEASRLIGVEVRVTGAIDARLLPSPQLTLHDIEIGKAGQAGEIRARALGLEFALGPLLRGEWRASELHLAGPQVTLGLDATGHVQAPSIAVDFNPDGITIERLTIEDAKVTLADAASSASLVVDKLWFNGEARSLLGPLKGEGAATVAGEFYPFRLSAGRYSDDDGVKLHVNVDPINRPMSIELDGMLVLAGGEPKFDGTLNLSRPVGIAARGPRAVTQPWRINSKIKVTAAAALMSQLEFQYGSEEQGLKLTGVADFKFGADPRFDGVLSGRQIDLDRTLAGAEGGRPLPAAAIRQLAEWGGAAFRPSIPIQIGVGIDQITLGGNTVQNLRGDISSGDGGWNLDRFEFRAPGFTQVRLSGRLAVGADDVVFTGPAEVDASDPKLLAAWLEGREDSQSDPRSLSLRGDVTLSGQRIGVERLKAEFDRKPVAGRFNYVFAAQDKPVKLDVTLNAPELDLDAAFGFGNALVAGSKMARPGDMTIAADVGRATIGGFSARNASARLKVDAGGLQIDRLSVTDLGGAAFSASGRIVTTAPSPQGDMRLDLDAPNMTPVLALLGRFMPEVADTLGRRAAAMAPAKLHARLALASGAATEAKVSIDGSLGKVRLALNGQGNIDAAAFSLGDVRLDGKLEADDGKTLVAMLGLDRAVAVGAGPGALMLNISGPARGELKVDGRLTGGGLDASLNGTAQPFAANPTAALRANLARADLAPLRGTSPRTPLPAVITGAIALAGKDLTLSDINATIGAATLRGKLTATVQPPYRVEGDLDADNIDGAGAIAAAVGMPAALSNNAAWSWSSEPFSDGAFGNFTGQVALKVRRFDLLPRLAVREFRATLRLADKEFVLDDVTGDAAGGKFAARLAFRSVGGGLKTQAKLSIAGAEAAAVLPAGARPPVTGTLGFSAEVEGSGLSPIALVGSLQGSGKLTLADAQFAGLDPRAFDAVTRAVDQGLPIETARITDVVGKALDSGQLAVKRAEGVLVISAGQIRLNDVSAESADAALALRGNLDLTDGTVDARLVLSGLSQAAGARPDIFMALKGSVAAPSRSVDVSALAGWLTLRAVENQSKRLKAIEANQPSPGSQAPQTKSDTKSDTAPALPAPINVRPLPGPVRNNPPPASISPQN